MGSFEFKWTHPASEVYVTGTFDDWSKSEKLVKHGEIFAKEVTLSDASAADKIYYKFVVDGNWITDHTAPHENDASGHLNNVLTIDRIRRHTPATAGIMSGVTPQSTTAALAKDVPLQKQERPGSSDLPGTFPETPAAVERDEVSINPLPAADGGMNPIKLAPGEKVPDPSSFTTNTITSGVHDDPELVAADRKRQEGEQTFDVSPLPAFVGAVNPIQLAPGRQDPNSSTEPRSNADTGNVLLHSVGPQSTTAQLASNVPLEASRVPEVVKSSQREAGVSPETSAIPSEVREKSAVEQELLREVPTSPVTSEGTAGVSEPNAQGSSAGNIAAAASGAAMAAGGVAAGVATRSGLKDKLPESVQKSIDEMNSRSMQMQTAKDTPDVVKESLAKSGQSPEAASNEHAVLEKKAVEKELLSEIRPDNSTGESAPQPTATPAEVPSEATPAVVRDSIAQSGQSPEATTNAEAVEEKKAVEKELLSATHREQSSIQTSQQSAPTVTTGLDSAETEAVSNPTPATQAQPSIVTTNTSAVTPATTSTVAPGATTATPANASTVAPSTTPAAAAAAPVKTPTVASSATPATPAKTLAVPTTASPASATSQATENSTTHSTTDKKKKRMSLLTKIKAKITDKLDKH